VVDTVGNSLFEGEFPGKVGIQHRHCLGNPFCEGCLNVPEVAKKTFRKSF